MKIALVSQEYPPETGTGGIGSQTYAKAHGLAALGHEVHVVSRSPNGIRREYCDRSVQVTRIGGFGLRMPIHNAAVDWLTYSAEVAAELAALHTRRALDLVDFPEWGGEGYFHLLNRPESDRLKVLIQIHGPAAMFAHTMGWPEAGTDLSRVAIEMEGVSLRRADAVYSSSAYSADWCVRAYGLAPGRIPTLHTGVDTHTFHPRRVNKEQRPTVVFAGRITRNKGARVLVEAACQLAHDFPGLRVRLLGRGEEQFLNELQDTAVRHGLPDLLHLPGMIDRSDLPDQFSRAHVYAGPSLSEGGPGLSYLEAMACGLPVVASAGTGAAEVIDPGKNGLLATPGDAISVAAALRQLLRDSALREAMGSQGRDYVCEHADSRVCLRRLETFYEATISSHG